MKRSRSEHSIQLRSRVAAHVFASCSVLMTAAACGGNPDASGAELNAAQEFLATGPVGAGGSGGSGSADSGAGGGPVFECPANTCCAGNQSYPAGALDPNNVCAQCKPPGGWVPSYATNCATKVGELWPGYDFRRVTEGCGTTCNTSTSTTEPEVTLRSFFRGGRFPVTNRTVMRTRFFQPDNGINVSRARLFFYAKAIDAASTGAKVMWTATGVDYPLICQFEVNTTAFTRYECDVTNMIQNWMIEHPDWSPDLELGIIAGDKKVVVRSPVSPVVSMRPGISLDYTSDCENHLYCPHPIVPGNTTP
jgi:hypothetical protein